MTHLTVGIHIVMRLRWIDLGQQETCLRSTLFGVDVSGHGEASLQYFLCIIDRRLPSKRIRKQKY